MLGTVATGIKAIYAAMATGYVSKTGFDAIDQLFSRGGMASLLTTVWLVLAALSFAAILEHAGFLERLLLPIVTRARSRGQLILAVNASGVGLNVDRRRPVRRRRAAGTDVPQRVRAARPRAPGAFARGRGLRDGDLRPRAMEHLRRLHLRRPGVSTASYLPYCYFNLLSPILDVVYGFLGFKVPAAPAPEVEEPDDVHVIREPA